MSSADPEIDNASANFDRKVSAKVLWLVTFFFLSGFSALVYEVAWVRLLGLVLGNTTHASSCVLAVFMGGLALGAFAAGRWSEKLRRHLSAYAAIEMGIAVSAPIATYLIGAMPEHYLTIQSLVGESLPALTVVRLVFCSVLLLIPTTLMGATLPVLVRASVNEHPAQFFGRLYTMNVFGAIIGTLFCTFVGFAYFGIWETIFAAASVNALIAVCAQFFVSRLRSGETPAGTVPPLETEARDSRTGVTKASSDASRKIATVCALSFLIGYAALSYEVLWTRLMRFYLTSLTYTFTAMISSFLLGMTLGSFIYQRVICKKSRTVDQQFLSFGKIGYLAAIACAGSLIYMPITFLIRAIWPFPVDYIMVSPGAWLLEHFVVCFVAILPPATLLGVLFPLAGGMSVNLSDKVGRAIGTTYAANTLGCIAGSLVTGLILIPAVGAYTTFQITVIVSVVAAAIAFWNVETMSRGRRIAGVLIPVAFSVLFLVCVHYPIQYFITILPEQKLLRYGEDTTGSMYVLQVPLGKQLILNGSSLATTTMPSRRYMRFLGDLPALLHPNPERALVGCFGTGTTCGAIVTHPEVKHLDIVELSSMVLGAGELFSDYNHGVLKNPKVTTHVNDVRNYLLGSKDKYDFITFEPPPPAEAGMVSLYTEEFYRLAEKHLNENGILCQWIPVREQSADLWKRMVQAGRHVFEHVYIWVPNSGEALLVMSDKPLKLDAAQVSARMQDPAVKSSMHEVGFDDGYGVISTLMLCGPALEHMLQGVPSLTDNKPYLEFFAPYAGPLMTEGELAKMGQDSVAAELRKYNPIFEDETYARHRAALELARRPGKTKTEQEASLNKALELVPDNQWFKFLIEQRATVYGS